MDVSVAVPAVSVLIVLGVVVVVPTVSPEVLVSEPVAGAGVSQATIPARSMTKRITLFIIDYLGNVILPDCGIIINIPATYPKQTDFCYYNVIVASVLHFGK